MFTSRAGSGFAPSSSPAFLAALCAVTLTVLAPSTAQSQDTNTSSTQSAASTDMLLSRAQLAMRKIAWLIGDWQGEGWTAMSPGTRTIYRQTERVTQAAHNSALVVHGEGTERDSLSGNWLVRFQAAGLLTYDAAEGRYRLMTAGGSGRAITVDPEIRDDGFTWGFDAGQVSIRYIVTHTADDEWHETGEMSPDGGKTWRQFMGMTLRRR